MFIEKSENQSSSKHIGTITNQHNRRHTNV